MRQTYKILISVFGIPIVNAKENSKEKSSITKDPVTMMRFL